MKCPDCERLRAEREAAEQRCGYAMSRLAASGLASLESRELLRIDLTAAKLYRDMAEGEIVRHQTLAHKDRDAEVISRPGTSPR
jgi:hypothetical protein